MEIKDIQGNILFDVPITQSAVKIEELMKQYNITLSWNAVVNEVLPLGSYIEHEGIRYSLLEPYSPEQRDEATYEYRPVFQHPIMRLGKALFFFYTYSGGSIVSKELDWSLTDNPANFMSAICDAISNELGEEWSYEVASDLAASASLSFSNTDIFSALNSIAGAFETEWWFDYSNRVLYLSKASHGEAITLEVGQNIGVPQVTQSKEGYYTRFYGFGSTRNIDQSYAGANVNSIVNRRLTLDPAKYPNGYIDIREGLTQEEVLPLPLVFDDIYPRSSLTISDVKVRLMWRLDDNSQKIQIGTDSEGNPVYDQYAIWYFKIPDFTFSKDLLISGKALSVHFNSGLLNGREFELTYHDKRETLTNSDGTDFVVEAGDYEINFVEEGTFIIPAVTGLIPADGDAVTLFNIIMPEDYKASAYAELEEAVRKRIAEQEEDRNNYSFESNKVAFYESNPNLTIGRAVTYKNGTHSISTRVIRLETQIDYPFEQRITVGNAVIKGNQQTLKEEVVNANQNIDLLAAINESSEAFQQSLQRTQKAVLESIAKMPDLGLSLVEQNGKIYLRSKYSFFSEGGVSSGGLSDTEGGGGTGGSVVSVTPIITETDGVPIAKILVDGVPNTIYAPKTAEVDLTGYATIDYVSDAIQNAKDTRVDTLINTTIPALRSDITTLRGEFDALNALLSDDVSGKINTWNEVVDFLDEYSGSQDLATILSGINADIAKRALQSSLDTHISAYNNFVTTTNSTLNTHSNRIKVFEDMFEWDGENIKAKANFYSVGGVSSGGNSNTEGGGSGGGSTVSWANTYTSANGLKIAAITIDGVDTNVYTAKALSQYTNDVGYLTTHQPIYALTINNSAGTAQVTYTPNSKAASLTLTKAMVGLGNVENTALSTWVGTSKITTLGTITTGVWHGTAITNAYINDVAFSKITSKPTTLSGYGITDAYTASTIDSKLAGYLPLSGGTIISGNYNPLSIKSSVGSVQLYLYARDSLKTILQYNGNFGAGFHYNEVGGLYINDNGVPTYYDSAQNAHTLIHSGNIGSQSVTYATNAGNANTLDGLYETGFYRAAKNVIPAGDLAELEAGSYYAGTFLGDTNPLPTSYVSLSVLGKSYYSQQLCVTHSATRAWLRGIINTATKTVYDWHEIAFTDSNVASATKLQTARTIWGQSFDGSANVSGLLTGATGIMSGSLCLECDTTGTVAGRTGEINRYAGALHIQYNTSHGVTMVMGGGKVGIGTVSPAYKLDVVGTIRATSRIYANEWIEFGGTAGLYFPNSGAGTHIVPNTVSTYGGFMLQGAKGNYCGFLLGPSVNYLNVMSNEDHQGLYNQNNNRWVIYYSRLGDTIGIGTSSNQSGYLVTLGGATYVGGNFLATGGVTSGSDARYKAIESYAEIDIETIANAPIINFKWTDREDARVHLGSTAQYWYGTPLRNGVIPTDSKELWTMGYGQIALASVVSVAKKVVNHEERIKALEMENKELRQQLEQYRRA